MNEKLRTIKQVNNVLETSIEGLEHIQGQLREGNYEACTNLYNDIIQGFISTSESISNILNNNQELLEIIKQIQIAFEKIVDIYNNKSYKNLIEITSFSLIPLYKKYKDVLYHSYLVEDDNFNKYIIGIYHPIASPRQVMPTNRVTALINEAHKQNASLIFFSDKDIKLNKKTIYGEVYVDGKFIKKLSSFPDVIQNYEYYLASKRSYKEQKLREIIPFTSYSIGNKYTLPSLLLKSPFKDYVIPFEVVSSTKIVKDFIFSNNEVVIKPINNRRGEDIFFVQKIDGKFIIKEHTNIIEYNDAEFNQFIEEKCLQEGYTFIIQPYIKSRTKDGLAFDVRAHIQKNGEAKWVLTKIYSRIGVEDSILSNISLGGRSEDIEAFIKNEYPSQNENIIDTLKYIAFELAEFIDRNYNYSIEELGIDLAIDEEGNIWIIEANTGPQSKYHEEERAINTIAYSIYLAEKGILLTNPYENK